MQIFAAILIIPAGICLAAAGYYLSLYWIFDHRKSATVRVSATLRSVRHKKDMPVYGKRLPGFSGPMRTITRIKNYSSGRYEYSVNGKTYTIRHSRHLTAKQMPGTVSVICLKKFPAIAYVKSDVSSNDFAIYALSSAMLGIIFIIGGLSVIFSP